MKTLTTILLLLTFISCEKSSETSSSSPSNNVVEFDESVDVESIPLLDGLYESECTLEGGKYFKYHLDVDVPNYEVSILKTEATNSNCEGMKSTITVEFNMNGDDIDYASSHYLFVSAAGGTFICGESGMSSGDYHSIDGIGCDKSYENKTNKVSINDDDNFELNGIEFTLI